MSSIEVTNTAFEKLVYSSKAQLDKTTIEKARLLLLHYHPDVAKENNCVLALMFNMNTLWEKFADLSLFKHKLLT